MRSTSDEVAMQGIEFWTTVCDEENELFQQMEEVGAALILIVSSHPLVFKSEEGAPPPVVSRFYAKGALPYLVPLLCELLTRQDEMEDEDDWTVAKAATICLTRVAVCCKDDCLKVC